MERTYIGLIHKAPNSDYGVSFPDLPGCITAGGTLEEARAMAAEALTLHIEGMAYSDMKIPQPSSADAVVAHPDACDAIALLVVKAVPEYAGVRVSSNQ